MTTRRPRTARRILERATMKLVEQREKLAVLSSGGAPEHPFDVRSASVIEVHARAVPCPRCDGELRIDEHRALTAPSGDGGRLRAVDCHCKACGAKRTLYFRILEPN